MKYIPIITAIAFACAAAMPAAAHDMCEDLAVDCPDEIGDALGIHSDMAEDLLSLRPDLEDMGENSMGEAADPVDDDAPGELSREPQSGTGPDGWDDYKGYPYYQGSE